jgi:hypothetical protein
VRLLLHSQVVSTYCGVLRELFLVHKEGSSDAVQVRHVMAQTPSAESEDHRPCIVLTLVRRHALQEPVDLTSTFQGASLAATACFLRFMYSHTQAHAGNLAVLAHANLLQGVTMLAHKLDASELIKKIVRYLEGGVQLGG